MFACMQVGVYDTAFHQTMPPAAHVYALPYDLYEQHGVRRFGAHGTSYRFILQQVAEHYGKPAHTLNLIVAHLGAVRQYLACCTTWCQHARLRSVSRFVQPWATWAPGTMGSQAASCWPAGWTVVVVPFWCCWQRSHPAYFGNVLTQ